VEIRLLEADSGPIINKLNGTANELSRLFGKATSCGEIR